MSSAAQRQLREAFPHMSADQVDDALRRCGGDPSRAVEQLLRAAPTPTRSGASGPQARLPDLATQPEAWFRHFDRNGNGLERHEVVEAVLETFQVAHRSVVQELIDSLWPMFDIDSSGAISLREFTKRDGLREALLAQLGESPQPSQQQQQHYQPGQPCRPDPTAHGAGAATAAADMQLRGMFPSVSSDTIREALGRCRGSVAAAAEWLMQHQKPFGCAGVAGWRPGAPAAPPKPPGRRRALLVGVNYFNTSAALRGCINDVHNVRSLLTQSFGWPAECIRVLTDDNPHAMPTRANIERAMRWLSEGSQPGDVLFFHFSGHGAQQEDPHGFEEDGMNETILPVDFKRAGMITDDQMGDLMVKHLPEGVRMTAVMDCCHSGTGLDLPYSWGARGWREETNPYHSRGDVQLFSGCADDDTSADSSGPHGSAGGAMTTAFCDVLRASPCPTYPELMGSLNQLLHRRGFRQHAQLTSSQSFHFARPFLLDDVMPNGNHKVGRIFRKKFSPRPRPMQGPLADMLGVGGAVLGGMVVGDVLGGLIGGLLG